MNEKIIWKLSEEQQRNIVISYLSNQYSVEFLQSKWGKELEEQIYNLWFKEPKEEIIMNKQEKNYNTYEELIGKELGFSLEDITDCVYNDKEYYIVKGKFINLNFDFQPIEIWLKKEDKYNVKKVFKLREKKEKDLPIKVKFKEIEYNNKKIIVKDIY